MLHPAVEVQVLEMALPLELVILQQVLEVAVGVELALNTAATAKPAW
jgi:hypothetical protein